MSEDDKPKPMSLKDRIAAFNQQASQQSAPPPPRPAAKPANWAWKQKQAEAAAATPTPSAPAPANTSSEPTEATKEVDERSDRKAGMSASDAKEAIKGQSLKERMAALQGKGFNAAPEPAPRPPVSEKPRVWKRPVVPQSGEEGAEDAPFSPPLPISLKPSVTSPSDDAEAVDSAEPAADSPADGAEAGVAAPEAEAALEEDDEEEQERQRRARIAARMAKLGGARVGMGPPVFGRPAAVRASSSDVQSEEPARDDTDAADTPTVAAKIPLPGLPTPPVPASDVQSPTAVETPSSAEREAKSPPLSVPKRALPPRKKAPQKSTSVDSESSIPASTAQNDLGAPDAQHPVTREPSAIAEETNEDSEAEAVHGESGSLKEETDVPTVVEPASTTESLEEEAMDKPEHLKESTEGHPTLASLTPVSPNDAYDGEAPPASPGTTIGQHAMELAGSDEEEEDEEDSPPAKPTPVTSTIPSPPTSSAPSFTFVPPALRAQLDEEDQEEEEDGWDEDPTPGGPPPTLPRHVQASLNDEQDPTHTPNPELAVPPPPPAPSALVTAESTSPKVSTISMPSESLPTRGQSTQEAEPLESPPRRRSLPPPPPPPNAPPARKPSEHSTEEQVVEDDEEEEETRNLREDTKSESTIDHSLYEPDEETIDEDPEEETLPEEVPDQAVHRQVQHEQTPPRPLNERKGSLGGSRLGSPPPVPAGYNRRTSLPPPPDQRAPSPSSRPTSPPPVPAGFNKRTSLPPPPGRSSPSPRSSISMASPPPVPAGFQKRSSLPPPPDQPLPSPKLRPTSPPPMPAGFNKRSSLPPSRPTPRPTAEVDQSRALIDSLEEAQTTHVAEPETTDDVGAGHAQAPTEEDEEAQRKRTLAERMAKLGGMRFGGAPPIPGVGRSPSRSGGQARSNSQTRAVEEPEEDEEETEEASRTRRAAIAARLAGMGGLRFGMIPGSAPSAPPPPPETEAESKDEDMEVISMPESPASSVQFDAEEESEAEDIHADESKGSISPAAPPPIPAQIPPPLPPGRRPAVPAGFVTSPPRRPDAPPPPPPPVTTPGAEYVLVDEPTYTGTFRQGRRSMPPPPAPSAAPPPPPLGHPRSPELSASQQWELTSIPTSEPLEMVEGKEYDEEPTHSEDDTSYPTSKPPAGSRPTSLTPQHSLPPPPPPSKAAPAPSAPRTYASADDLSALYNRIGKVVYARAAALVEYSRKSVIGDGSGPGFVRAVLEQVPSALAPYSSSGSTEYGPVIYLQTGPSVQRRASDIMPGDIATITEGAKFKGHRGLTGYSTTTPAPIVGVVHEFEEKKGKVKVWQASMHANQYPTVESVSYRLDDLKNGSVKIYRVADA